MHVTTPHEASRPHKRTSKVLAAIQGPPVTFSAQSASKPHVLGQTLELRVGNWAAHVVDTLYFLEANGGKSDMNMHYIKTSMITYSNFPFSVSKILFAAMLGTNSRSRYIAHSTGRQMYD